MTLATPALAALALRIAGALIFVAQGRRKLLGPPTAPHGLANLEGMIRARGLPRSWRLARLVALTELVGGIALLVGLGTRVATAALGVVLVVAIVGFKRQAGFLGGWDWPFSVLAILVALALLGAGPWSVDSLLGVP